METKGYNEDDLSRQMDMWEDNVSMALFTGGHMEAKLDNTTNIERVKKRMMRYPCLEDPCFSRT